ncbi:methyltransferase [Candidatus Woesearchaeota archaeon]|nr:methyltransferase [Candidatus Woesearchaeota archaeon]
MDQVYFPREDSYLLQNHVEKYSKECELVLDMGTGSGIQAITAAKKAKYVLACDINEKSVEYVKKEISYDKIKNITVFQSDLFDFLDKNYFDLKTKTFTKSNKKNRFDLIVFNPPYLIQDLGIKDDAIYGGKRGYETTERFLNRAGDFLKDNGKILITSSSLVNQEKIQGIIDDCLLESEKIDSEHYFFETVFVHLIKKKELLKKLHEKKISNIKFFARGKRGVIHTANYKNKKIAVKSKKKSSNAMNTIQNEANFLKILNKKNIGPRLVLSDKEFLCYVFVEGKFSLDYFEKANKKEIVKILKEVFEQCFIMDKLGINKFEMHHPVKHILITKDLKPVLIDFERARFTENPKNVTQFCDFLICEKVNDLLRKKGIEINEKEMIDAAKNYKKKKNKNNFNLIISRF